MPEFREFQNPGGLFVKPKSIYSPEGRSEMEIMIKQFQGTILI